MSIDRHRFNPSKFHSNVLLRAPAPAAYLDFFHVFHMDCFTARYVYTGPSTRLFKSRPIVAEVDAHFNALDTVYLLGSPGTGKSFAAWKLICDRAQVARQDVCLYWIDAPTRRVILFRNKRVMFYGPRCPFDESRIDANCSHVVIDGVTAESQRDWDDAAAYINGVCGSPHILICSSAQLVMKHQFVVSLGAVYKAFMPWTLPEYRAACSFDLFFAEVYPKLSDQHHANPTALSVEERHELLDNKYITAGFSCRYMFDFTTQQVVEDILTHFEYLAGPSMLISGLRGCRSNDSVSHLVFGFGFDNSTPVSSLVVRRATRFCDEAFIRTVTEYSMGIINQSLNDWVLEFDVLHALRRTASAEGHFFAVTPTETAGEWMQRAARDDLAPSPGAFPAEGMENNELRPEHLEDGRWFFPVTYHNGGFDAVQLLIHPTTGVRTFRFVQIARGTTRSLTLCYVDAFTKAYNARCEVAADRVTRVEMVIVAPIRACRVHYSPCTTVLGTLADFGWAVDQLQVVGFVRSAANA